LAGFIKPNISADVIIDVGLDETSPTYKNFDDKLFRQAQTIQNLSCKVTTLLGLVPEVTI
jgi:hypothetical protein